MLQSQIFFFSVGYLSASAPSSFQVSQRPGLHFPLQSSSHAVFIAYLPLFCRHHPYETLQKHIPELDNTYFFPPLALSLCVSFYSFLSFPSSPLPFTCLPLRIHSPSPCTAAWLSSIVLHISPDSWQENCRSLFLLHPRRRFWSPAGSCRLIAR